MIGCHFTQFNSTEINTTEALPFTLLNEVKTVVIKGQTLE